MKSIWDFLYTLVSSGPYELADQSQEKDNLIPFILSENDVRRLLQFFCVLI